VEEVIECHTLELTKNDLDELISEDNNGDDVAKETALNHKAPAEIMKLQGVLIGETVACNPVRTMSSKFKMKF
jgi:nicotinate-nucleotide pyrophosphorylase